MRYFIGLIIVPVMLLGTDFEYSDFPIGAYATTDTSDHAHISAMKCNLVLAGPADNRNGLEAFFESADNNNLKVISGFMSDDSLNGIDGDEIGNGRKSFRTVYEAEWTNATYDAYGWGDRWDRSESLTINYPYHRWPDENFASSGYALYAREAYDSAGYILRDLIYNYQQRWGDWGYKDTPKTYTAKFFCKSPSADTSSVIARLEAWRIDWNGNEVLLDSLSIRGSHLTGGDSYTPVELSFALYARDFCRSCNDDGKGNTETDSISTMDYRVYYNSVEDLYIDKIDIINTDFYSEEIHNGDFDDAIVANIDTVMALNNSDHVLDFEIGEEPHLSEFLTAARYRENYPTEFGGFANLFPEWAGRWQHEAPSYEEYIETYIQEVNPSYIEFNNNYFLLSESNYILRDLTKNLKIVRDKTLAAEVDFWFSQWANRGKYNGTDYAFPEITEARLS